MDASVKYHQIDEEQKNTKSRAHGTNNQNNNNNDNSNSSNSNSNSSDNNNENNNTNTNNSGSNPESIPLLCRICNQDEDHHLLIAPCNCSGSLARVHTSCLQTWIATRPRPNIPGASSEDGRMICEICHTDYRINVSYKFSFSYQRCCKSDSLGHIFELFVLLIILIVCLAMWPILTKRAADSQESWFGSSAADSALIPIISIFMVILTFVTIYKVAKRWVRANSVVSISPQVPLSSSSSSSSSSSQSSLPRSALLNSNSHSEHEMV